MDFNTALLVLILVNLIKIDIPHQRLEKIKNMTILFLLILIPTFHNANAIDYRSGLDNYVYRSFYTQMLLGNFQQHGDYLFDKVSWLLAGMKLNVYSYFFILSLIQIILVVTQLINYSRDWKKSLVYYILIFYPTFHFNIIRQGISVSLGLLALDKYFRKKIPSFLLVITTAILVHKSAILVLLYIIIDKIKLKKHLISKLIFFFTFMIVFGKQINVLINRILENFFLVQRYNHFFYEYRFTSGYLLYMIHVSILMILIIIISKNHKTTRYENLILKVNFIGLIFMYSISSIVIFRRFVYYFSIFTIILYPNFFLKSRFKNFLFMFSDLVLLIIYFTTIY